MVGKPSTYYGIRKVAISQANFCILFNVFLILKSKGAFATEYAQAKQSRRIFTKNNDSDVKTKKER